MFNRHFVETFRVEHVAASQPCHVIMMPEVRQTERTLRFVAVIEYGYVFYKRWVCGEMCTKVVGCGIRSIDGHELCTEVGHLCIGVVQITRQLSVGGHQSCVASFRLISSFTHCVHLPDGLNSYFTKYGDLRGGLSYGIA